MNYFGIAKTRAGKYELLEGTREDLVLKMNEMSNKGSNEYESIKLFSGSSYSTRRKFKEGEPTPKAKKK